MKITSISTDEILFDNGSSLIFYHEQDCCEQVYADCGNIQSLSSENLPYNEANFDSPPKYKLAEGVGVELISTEGMRYLISCYNIQNGYYSSWLEMSFKTPNSNGIILESNVDKYDCIDCCRIF